MALSGFALARPLCTIDRGWWALVMSGEILEDATLSAYLSVLQESALDGLPPSQDSSIETLVEQDCPSPARDSSRGKKRAASTASEERLVQNAAAQKRYRMRQKNEKEQAKEKQAALERRMKSIEDVCSVMQSQIAMLEAAQRTQSQQQPDVAMLETADRAQLQQHPDSANRDCAIDTQHINWGLTSEPHIKRERSVGAEALPTSNDHSEINTTSTAVMLQIQSVKRQIPLEQMVVARIRAMLSIVTAGKQPDTKTDQLLRHEIRNFWAEKQVFERQLIKESGMMDARWTLLMNAMDVAPQRKVDIDQDTYTSLMRCYDKANYSKETLERITALQDSHAACMRTIRLERLAINSEIIALMQRSQESLSSADETVDENSELGATSTELATSATSHEVDWQERMRSAFDIVQATQRLRTNLKAEQDATKDFVSKFIIDTLPAVVSAHMVLVILETKHRNFARIFKSDQAVETPLPASGTLTWIGKFIVTLRRVVEDMSKLLAAKHAAGRQRPGP